MRQFRLARSLCSLLIMCVISQVSDLSFDRGYFINITDKSTLLYRHDI